MHERVRLDAGAVVLAPQQGGEAPTVLESDVVVGANATVYPGVRLGRRSQVLPGSVVNRSVPPLAIVSGNPAKILGYVDTPGPESTDAPAPGKSGHRRRESHVEGVFLHWFPLVNDLRGNLVVGETSLDLPFVPQRFILVFGVPTAETRGAHAHLRCHQMLVCVSGRVRVAVDDGSVREEFQLDRPELGLYVPAMTWATQFDYSADAVLLVLASEPYDSDEYLRDYDSFLEERKRG